VLTEAMALSEQKMAEERQMYERVAEGHKELIEKYK
jgi:hypothetical protein